MDLSENKELCLNLIKALEYLESKGNIDNKLGSDLFGEEQWAELKQYVKSNARRAIVVGNWGFVKGGLVERKALKLECQRHLKNIQGIEKSQRLADRNNISGIFVNWITIIGAIFGSVTGGLSLLNQIFHWF